MKIRVFVTGGTFDKEYDELNEKLDFRKTHLHQMLKRGRSRINVKISTLMMIDSINMTEFQRELIAKNINEAQEKNIVITHGTGSMAETAKYLLKNVKDKTVVLTGGMVPYAFGSSDGMFNLGSAIAFVQTLPNGVYVSMNGRCFEGDKVKKNIELGFFEEIK